MPSLARTLKGRFPRNLHAAPMLLPTQNCSLRRDLENWFRSADIQPSVVGEFEDGAFAKIAATSGMGIIAVPAAVISEAVERYGFVPIGRTKQVETRFYAITAERRFTHPAVIAITAHRRRSKKSRRSELS
jgi:LysR family transcriptional regulator, transcriptional activator of nhaA